MTTEVENIILNKEYFELTAEELITVNELVSSAEEYDEMKWFLASTQQALVSEKVEATPELKEKVMDYLHQDEKKRRFWLNSLGVFLWPEEKQFYQRPAFQMSLAALLLIGFIMVYDRPLEDQNMAVNDTTITPSDIEGDSDSTSTNGFISEVEEMDEDEDFGIVDEDNNLEDVINNRNLASELERPDVDLPLSLTSSSDANVMDMESDDLPQDGYYQGPLEDSESEDVSVNKDTKLTATGVVQSKSNANNNEGAVNGDVDKVVVSTQDVSDKLYKNDDKDKRKQSRDGLKKNELKKGKFKDGKSTGEKKDNDNLAVTYDEEDVEEDPNVEETGGGYQFNSMGNNTSNELNQNMANEPIGGVTNGNVVNTEVNSAPGTTTVDDFDNSTIILEEKEQQIIKPYQLHIDSTKELKSLFKTMK